MFEPYKPGDLVIVCDWPDGKVGIITTVVVVHAFMTLVEIISESEVTIHNDITVIRLSQG